ncbi:hypothetical protein CC78DRAFT_536144 [Lojkania enalia]|uniref:ORC6 first cyclin-like domain-containing protein n=1 Tax=Lojkania enalia TaxID=147567 RepID=A0A9P4N6N7_9PLEO|nr:hypothetical protein CC78DRAFT_536144 [Didymosphaeria enalia]
MSRASIEQALTTLIPTFNSPLPVDLIELSLSLLARSRSVAHSLKPDEEIARPYACAQLACERLKKQLNLPTITSRPPCPPRIYKKLYNYLESALPASTSAPHTPRKNAVPEPKSARTTPKTPLSARKMLQRAAQDKTKLGEPPEWTMPTIRTLVKEFDNANTAPHVYAGVASILPFLARIGEAAAETPSKRPRRAATQASRVEVSDMKVLALIAVIFFYVLSRISDQEITPEQFEEWRDSAVEVLLKSKTGEGVEEEGMLAEIDQLMPMAQEEGWLQMEWFLNVFPVEGEEMEGVEMVIANGNGATPGRGEKMLRDGGSSYIGLGTMMQDATDYLSERRRAEYKVWKAKIMARVAEIEQS